MAFDTDRLSVGRVHNVLLRGIDHYTADRDETGELTRIYSGLCDVVLKDREFLARAITWAARQGDRPVRRLGYGTSVAAVYRRAETCTGPGWTPTRTRSPAP